MMDNDYRAGLNDARTTHLEGQTKELWREVKSLRSWQNRAIGYVAAIGSLVTVVIQLLLKKFGL